MNKFLTVSVFLVLIVSGVLRAQDTTGVATENPAVTTQNSPVSENDSTKIKIRLAFNRKWAFGFNGGYSYRLPNKGARTNQPYSKYLRNLKSGYSLGADFHRFTWPQVGLGLKYNIFKSQGDFDNKNGDDITIQFVGPSAVYQYPFKNNTTSVLAGFALGYQSYINKGISDGNDFTNKANAMGWAVSVGLEQKLSNHFALNISGACYLGTAYKFKREAGGVTETINLSKEKFEDLSRVELTLGLKFF
ncbi:porin family protein [Dyadobacter sp. CY345]|uniref:porin family protein n=1 Tax=Dyadobacter sp. CY345 TaxID=2909335 RepID=UPI001F401A65|nr:porin family protein [Dyadobacter sp. CY345]MCF2443025.1 porin family protein [Dyadobacter sp. CY345]